MKITELFGPVLLPTHDMYQEALHQYKNHGGWIKYNDWFDDLRH